MNNKTLRLIISTIAMIVGTTIYCFGIVFVLDMVEFYAGGVTGIAQIFANVFKMPYLKSIIIGAVNLPLFIMGWKGVSKRFAVLSLASILLQMALTALFDYMRHTLGINPFNDLATWYEGTVSNPLVFALFGGALTGLGCGIPLRFGSSTGGMDIVSQKFALSSKIPFPLISGGIDAAIIIVGALIAKDVSVAVYTIIRLVIHVIVLDKVHTIYNYQKISIVTSMRDEMREALVKHFAHGITIYDAQGGYSLTPKYVFESVVFTYEIEEYKKIIRNTDKDAFMSFTSIKGIDGKYNKKVIE
jgi:uncharacterized membrane-anchored protein YitT (DUF2179 family)